ARAMAEIAAIVLAAGRASRYRAAGGAEPTKLVAEYRGQPLVRWAARAALASRARPVIVVTGHARAEVEAVLAGLDLRFVHNADFAEVAGLRGDAGARGLLQGLAAQRIAAVEVSEAGVTRDVDRPEDLG